MKKGLFTRLKDLFFGSGNEEVFEELEDVLIEGDLGVKTAMAVGDQLRDLAKKNRLKSREDLRGALKSILLGMVKSRTVDLQPDQLNLFLVLGVNGVGKTTSLAKMARFFQKRGESRIVLCAGDTFRAAAIEQIKHHGQKLEVRVVSQDHGSDPGAVLFDTLDSARARGEVLVLADTAGRMHNQANLVKELQKIHKIAQAKVGTGQYLKILVLDGTTGQNAFQQAQVFHEAVGVDAAILSKYDSSGKGGVAVAISHQLGIPFAFMGLGEKLDDLSVFESETFVEGILGEE